MIELTSCGFAHLEGLHYFKNTIQTSSPLRRKKYSYSFFTPDDEEIHWIPRTQEQQDAVDTAYDIMRGFSNNASVEAFVDIATQHVTGFDTVDCTISVVSIGVFPRGKANNVTIRFNGMTARRLHVKEMQWTMMEPSFL